MWQAFARSTLYILARVQKNAFCKIKNLKKCLNSNT